ncbi:MAG: phosphoglycerate dehydrogenase [Candidatus Omnitrophica bacterium]|nr:phosphoglycerate dehydrogenase [Candidatus Omnitrophota bacterium]
MGNTKVLVTDNLEQEGTSILKKANFEVDEKGKLSVEELEKIIGRYDVLIVRSGTRVPSSVIEKADNLKIIGRAGVGVDNVDVKTATAKGILVMNAPEGNTLSASEHTIGLILSLARNIPQADASLKTGKWERNRFMGTELFGKIIGIIGLGRIGKRVASIAHSLGMKVLGYDPYMTEEDALSLNISLMTLEGLCMQSDIISVHTPLVPETKHLLSEKQFFIMKDGVMIVNVARGGLIDEDILIKYIKNGKVRGVALDVFEKEPPLESELLKLDNAVVTPHLGASTREAQVNVARDICQQIIEAIQKKIIRNAINMSTMDEKLYEKMKGYLTLSEKLGIFLSQLLDDIPESLIIEYAGEIVNYDVSPLRAYVLKGFLERFCPVTYVNAPLILREKGIKLNEIKNKSAGEFFTTIRLEAKYSNESISVTGTVVSEKLKIVKINDFDVEAIPQGYLLICLNDDKPGLMGYIGTIIGKKNVNIASMTLGRKEKGGQAITVLNLDSEIDKQTIKEIEKFSGIWRIKLVRC